MTNFVGRLNRLENAHGIRPNAKSPRDLPTHQIVALLVREHGIRRRRLADGSYDIDIADIIKALQQDADHDAI